MTDNVTVHIPAALQRQADGHESLSLSGDTVGEVLGVIRERYPALGGRLFKGEETLNRFINVYVNDEDIRFLAKLDTPVSAGDEVSIVPAIAGG